MLNNFIIIYLKILQNGDWGLLFYLYSNYIIFLFDLEK